MWYGWIPILSDGDIPLVRGHPPRLGRRYSLDGTDDDGTMHVLYNSPTGAETISVDLEDGFIRLDGFRETKDRGNYTAINRLYRILKESYHLDVTHGPGGGLSVVKADSLEDAVFKTADMIVRNGESFLLNVGGVTDVATLRSIYIQSRGCVEYGLAFIQRYGDILGDAGRGYLERLTSLSRFIDTIYGTKRDEIQDELAYQNKTLSESMMKLSRNTERLSVAVIALTVVSAILSYVALIEGGGRDITWAVSVGVVVIGVFVAIVIGYELWRRGKDSEEPEDEEFRRSDGIGGPRTPSAADAAGGTVCDPFGSGRPCVGNGGEHLPAAAIPSATG